jgi:hypothetical protein
MMDDLGPDWCETNIQVVTGWLREAATKHKLPFNETAAKLLIKLAIRRSRKKNTGD